MRHFFRCCQLFTLVLVLAACQSVSPSERELAVTVDPSHVAVQPGGEAEVAVTVSDGSGIVALEATGLPAGVTPDFDPAEIDGDGASTLTLAAAPDAAGGAFDVTVAAEGDSGRATAALDLEIETMTVRGRVENVVGEPEVGVAVAIGDVTAVTTAGGEFSIPGVTAPYDLVVYRLGAPSVAHVFAGLTTEAPTVTPYAEGAVEWGSTATVVADVEDPIPAGHDVLVCVEGLTTPVPDGACRQFNGGSAPYEVTPSWWGASSLEARVHVLLLEVDVDDTVTGFGAYVTGDGTLVDGESLTIPFDLDAGVQPDETTVRAEAAFAAPAQDPFLSAAVRLPSGTMMPIDRLPGTEADFVVPVIDGATYGLLAMSGPGVIGAESGTSWDVDVAAGSTTILDVPDAPVLLEPPEEVVPVDTEFEIHAPSGGPFTYIFASDGAVILLDTMEESVTLPDLRHIGITGPSEAEAWQWLVTRPSLESYGPTWFQTVASTYTIRSGGPGPTESGSLMQSGVRGVVLDR